MTTLYGDNNNKIQLSVSSIIHECDRNIYIIESPTIVCDNMKTAKLMQDKINAFVIKLSKTILENNK